MKFIPFKTAADFLTCVQSALEENEAANNLMLGLSMRLAAHPERIKLQPFYGVVLEENEPILASIMTPPHHLVIYGFQTQLEPALDLLIQYFHTHQWSVKGVLGPSLASEQFAQAWSRHSGQKYHVHRSERVYELRRVIPPRPVSGTFRQGTQDDLALMTQWTYAFSMEALGNADWQAARELAELKISEGDLYLWEDPHPVSMACRTRPTQHGAVVSNVYTPKEFRGKGYASACVAQLSQTLLDSGCQFTALFTDLANPTANHIYQQIGYTPLCDYLDLAFVEEA